MTWLEKGVRNTENDLAWASVSYSFFVGEKFFENLSKNDSDKSEFGVKNVVFQ